MFSSAERYRRRAIEAQHHASHAADATLKVAFEEIAHNWLSLAEQADWLAAQIIPPASPVLQQQQQNQPKEDIAT